MPSKLPKVSRANKAISTDKKWNRPLPKKEDTLSYTTTWTVGNALSCHRCWKTVDVLYATYIKDSKPEHLITKLDGRAFVRCIDCLPSPKWTVSKWVEVVWGCAWSVFDAAVYTLLLLMASSMIVCAFYAAVTAA